MLPGTNLSGLPNGRNNAGIATESNTDYKYVGDNALYDYYKANSHYSKSAINQENSTSDLVLNED